MEINLLTNPSPPRCLKDIKIIKLMVCSSKTDSRISDEPSVLRPTGRAGSRPLGGSRRCDYHPDHHGEDWTGASGVEERDQRVCSQQNPVQYHEGSLVSDKGTQCLFHDLHSSLYFTVLC